MADETEPFVDPALSRDARHSTISERTDVEETNPPAGVFHEETRSEPAEESAPKSKPAAKSSSSS